MSVFPLSTTNTLKLSETGVYLSASHAIDYSEGSEAEAFLRQILSGSDDVSSHSAELENSIHDWSSEYHLTSARANVLRCLNLNGIISALELGCGCGSITRYLGESGIWIDAVEGSAGRAELARMRCRDLDNVKIIQANFNELEFPLKSYDAVFMIGVIEYASMFSPGLKDDHLAVAAILSRIRSTLKPGGVLILALENRMGLKYLYGAGEDHLASPYVGVYDYPGKTGVRTYSRLEWDQIFHKNGWKHSSFLFPFPDYKIPRVILNETFVKSDSYVHSLLYRIDSRDYLSSWSPAAHEFLSWKGIHKAGLLPELANSFLIVASADKASVSRCADKDFVHFSGAGRQPAYRTVTSKAVGEENVEKKKSSKSIVAANSIDQIFETSPYYSGELLITSWIECLTEREPFESLTFLLQDYYSFLVRRFADNGKNDAFIELLPSNIIVDTETGVWKTFDLEWTGVKSVSVEFVFFRAVFWFAIHNRKMIAAACAAMSFDTVEAFVSYCFARLGLDFKSNRLSFIGSEESFHQNVTKGIGQGIDISYMMAMALGNQNHVEKSSASIEKVESLESTCGETEPGSAFLPALAKRCAKTVRSYLLSIHCLKIRQSRIFDSNYYCGKDRSLQSLSVDPLLHYVEFGYKEGRDPSPLFSLEYYKQQYPQLIESELDPLLHFLERGWSEGAKTHPLLESYVLRPGSIFKKAELTKIEGSIDQAEYFVSYFDFDFYCNRYPDIESSGMLPVMHYLYHGGSERRQPGPFFDPEWYLDRTPFYSGEAGDLLDHYLKTGAAVGKSPVPVFDPEYYKKQNSGVGAGGTDIFAHYLKLGIHHDQKPCSWFDPSYYRKCCPDLTPYNFPLDHYLYKGVHEKIYVNKEVARLPQKPLISILIPVYNVKKSYLNCCIRSVLFQSYPHWELCLVDDGSSEAHVKPQLIYWAEKDQRIKLKFLEKNLGISQASNTAADLSSGDFLAFLDNDDELHPEAVFHMVKAICATEADLLYSDEDLIGDDGRRLSVFHKPDFNEELLYSHNYVTHLVLCRRSLFFSVGGFSPALSGAQDYDLFLKLSEQADTIEHVAEILYHWRASESSTSINHGEKEYADNAGRWALQNMLNRRRFAGTVHPAEWKFYYRVKRELPDSPRVSILIIAHSDAEFATWFEELYTFCSYPNLEFIVCGEGKQIDRLAGQFNTEQYQNIKLIPIQSVQYPARCYNKAVENCSGKYIIFYNAFLRIENADWIEALLEYCQNEKYGLVDGRILQDREEENFTIPNISQDSPFYYAKFLQQCSRHLNGLQCAQEVTMLSCHFTMISRHVFRKIGGFDEEKFSRLFFAHDLSLRLLANGYKNIYTPHALALSCVEENHHCDHNDDYQQEKFFFQKHWHNYLVQGDPYSNTGVVVQSGIGMDAFMKWYVGGSD